MTRRRPPPAMRRALDEIARREAQLAAQPPAPAPQPSGRLVPPTRAELLAPVIAAVGDDIARLRQARVTAGFWVDPSAPENLQADLALERALRGRAENLAGSVLRYAELTAEQTSLRRGESALTSHAARRRNLDAKFDADLAKYTALFAILGSLVGSHAPPRKGQFELVRLFWPLSEKRARALYRELPDRLPPPPADWDYTPPAGVVVNWRTLRQAPIITTLLPAVRRYFSQR